MELGLKNKNVLIVGASKGIGRGIVMGFAKEGSRIVAVARSSALLESLSVEAKEAGTASFSYENHDIMAEDAKMLAKRLMDQYGVFDVVIHNVGGSLISRDPLADADTWGYALKFNALAAIDMNSVFLPAMLEQGTGHIVHISSSQAVSLRGNPLYSSAKAFLNAYITTVGRALAAKGIVLASVMPGAVSFQGSYWDSFIREKHPRVEDFLRHHQAIGRFGTPEEIANVVLFLSSGRASFMPAVNLLADGAGM